MNKIADKHELNVYFQSDIFYIKAILIRNKP